MYWGDDMQLHRQFAGRKKRANKYKAIAEKLDLQCDYCQSYSQTIISMVFEDAVVSCNSCGKIWSKLIEENSEADVSVEGWYDIKFSREV